MPNCDGEENLGTGADPEPPVAAKPCHTSTASRSTPLRFLKRRCLLICFHFLTTSQLITVAGSQICRSLLLSKDEMVPEKRDSCDQCKKSPCAIHKQTSALLFLVTLERFIRFLCAGVDDDGEDDEEEEKDEHDGSSSSGYSQSDDDDLLGFFE